MPANYSVDVLGSINMLDVNGWRKLTRKLAEGPARASGLLAAHAPLVARTASPAWLLCAVLKS